ncbi:MAG: cation:proton antiporter [Treponema sp.]|nr:cation:proton antiporter [Treponema sp.]
MQLGIIFFSVRIFGRAAKKIGIPQVLGELIAGIVIGPYALGGIPLPGFAEGLFALGQGTLSVSYELYAIAAIGSVILLFASGLETDIGLFLRYSVAGGIIGLGGIVFSFIAGVSIGMLMFGTSLSDPMTLFLGVLSTATSLGITARVLSDQKKMDSPEGVTILAAAVFDDVLGIIILAVVMGIVGSLGGSGGLSGSALLGIAGKAFGIWLGFTVLGFVFAKKVALFLKIFKDSSDFSIMALGIALILSGFFEKQGLAMIIGACITGLSLSKTDIAPVIQEKTEILYSFFVPVFFAVMGMMVNIREILNPQVLTFGALYTGLAVLAKIIGCGGPALLMGFNIKGALRIGFGMVPRGEVAIIIAGIGLTSGILTQQIFSAAIIMTLITTLVGPPLLNMVIKSPGSGTRRPAKGDESASASWDFPSREIAVIVTNTLLSDLRDEGYYIQSMNLEKGLSQARKNDVSLSIKDEENILTIETARTDMPFVKTAVYEVIAELYEAVHMLKESAHPDYYQEDQMDEEARTSLDLAGLFDPKCISLDLQGQTKGEVIIELVDLLDAQGKLLDRERVIKDVIERESSFSTGMGHGVAIPHAKTDGVNKFIAALGIKKEGLNFESMEGDLSKIIVLMVSPKNVMGPHIEVLSALSSLLKDENIRSGILNAASAEELLEAIIQGIGHHH